MFASELRRLALFWLPGCQVSTTLRVPVHQYDCFNLNAPVCAGGDPFGTADTDLPE